MISREDFIFTIGYDGPVAIVDGQAKRAYGKMTGTELAAAGFFRAAYASAVYSANPDELDAVIAVFNEKAGSSLSRTSPLDRLFGTFRAEVERCKVL